jgi:hypothetical protein
VISLIGIPLGAIQEEITWRGYILRNLGEGFNWKIIGPRWALIIAVVITSVSFAWGHASNPNATMFSTLNTIVVTLLVLSAGYALTGELALPIGFHMAWNFVQVCVFGFPGGMPILGATFIAIEQSGPKAWTGGAYGPEGGWLGTVAFILGFLLIAVWVRFKHGGIRLRPLIAQPATQPTVSSLR